MLRRMHNCYPVGNCLARLMPPFPTRTHHAGLARQAPCTCDQSDFSAHAIGDQRGDLVEPLLPLRRHGQTVTRTAQQFSAVTFAAVCHHGPFQSALDHRQSRSGIAWHRIRHVWDSLRPFIAVRNRASATFVSNAPCGPVDPIITHPSNMARAKAASVVITSTE
jgi:transposase